MPRGKSPGPKIQSEDRFANVDFFSFLSLALVFEGADEYIGSVLSVTISPSVVDFSSK